MTGRLSVCCLLLSLAVSAFGQDLATLPGDQIVQVMETFGSKCPPPPNQQSWAPLPADLDCGSVKRCDFPNQWCAFATGADGTPDLGTLKCQPLAASCKQEFQNVAAGGGGAATGGTAATDSASGGSAATDSSASVTEAAGGATTEASAGGATSSAAGGGEVTTAAGGPAVTEASSQAGGDTTVAVTEGGAVTDGSAATTVGGASGGTEVTTAVSGGVEQTSQAATEGGATGATTGGVEVTGGIETTLELTPPAPTPVPTGSTGEPESTGSGEPVATTPSAGGNGTSGDCCDYHEFCCFWASIGECDKNKPFMAQICQQSCGSCGCSGDATACAVTASATCSGQGIKSNSVCPCTPGALVDRDWHPNCGEWSGKGFCESNAKFMVAMCKKSCSVCK